MDKVEQYRQVYSAFKNLCAEGKQTCSFRAFCIRHGVDNSLMKTYLKGEYQGVSSLPGFKFFTKQTGLRELGRKCREVYEDFKNLCAQGNQPGTFTSYYSSYGITRQQMHDHLSYYGLKVVGLPGFSRISGGNYSRGRQPQSIPFEDVIFEEAGFLPAMSSEISVKVENNVVVSFPADTDISIIAKFIKEMGKEAGHVGS